MAGKKILVGLDGSKYAQSAVDHALNLFPGKESLLVGVHVRNIHYGDLLESVKAHEPLYYQYRTDVFEFDAKVREAEGEKSEVIEQFRESCEKADVGYVIHNDAGAPVLELVEESRFADLCLLGFQTYFANNNEGDDLLHEVLKDAHCPVLVVPEAYKPVKNLIFSYDGRDTSFYAIKQFCYNFPELCALAKVTLLSVHKSEKEAMDEEEEKLVKEYLGQHCGEVEFHKVQGAPEDVILNALEFTEAPLVVMGSYGRSPLSMLFNPSTADKVLKHKKAPVFITHK